MVVTALDEVILKAGSGHAVVNEGFRGGGTAQGRTPFAKHLLRHRDTATPAAEDIRERLRTGGNPLDRVGQRLGGILVKLDGADFHC